MGWGGPEALAPTPPTSWVQLLLRPGCGGQVGEQKSHWPERRENNSCQNCLPAIRGLNVTSKSAFSDHYMAVSEGLFEAGFIPSQVANIDGSERGFWFLFFPPPLPHLTVSFMN